MTTTRWPTESSNREMRETNPGDVDVNALRGQRRPEVTRSGALVAALPAPPRVAEPLGMEGIPFS